MRKNEFLATLQAKLKNFNHSEVRKITEYYTELIDDKMENGMSEAEAVASLGDINSIINQVTADLIMERSNDQKTNPVKNLFIILGICASPILIPIGIALFVVFLSLLVVFFSVFLSFAASSISLLFAAIVTSVRFLSLNADLGLILVNAGGLLISCGILAILSVWTFRLGRLLLNTIIKGFSSMIKKKAKGEAK
ncbi:MAG: DUF1700 domain-containing protein [Acholeplasmataceae bacterium]|nr:DUF1700 domain-containing protein [Acholeplasmataceae bacterium]